MTFQSETNIPEVYSSQISMILVGYVEDTFTIILQLLLKLLLILYFFKSRYRVFWGTL